MCWSPKSSPSSQSLQDPPFSHLLTPPGPNPQPFPFPLPSHFPRELIHYLGLLLKYLYTVMVCIFHVPAPSMFMSTIQLLSTTSPSTSSTSSTFLNVCSCPGIASYSQPLFLGLAQLSAWGVLSRLWEKELLNSGINDDTSSRMKGFT